MLYAQPHELHHDAAQRRFYFDLPSGECYIDYQLDEFNVYDLVHTWTSPDVRGQDLAGKLTAAVCDWIAENDATLRPSCPYIASFIREHDAYAKLVA